MKPSKLLSAFTSLLLALFLLTAAIAVPILCRPFYYAQIGSLKLAEQTGWSQEVIRGAFDEVMDYLVKDASFGTGALKWSESGRSHFADCKALFRLDFILLGITALLLLLMIALLWRKKLRLYRFLGQGPCFWAFVGMAAVFLLLAAWALVDFTSLFTAFHTVFFPGKTNWVFDWHTDEIILILPEAFWVRAATLVAVLAFGSGAVLAVAEKIICCKTAKNVYEELRALR